MTGVLDIAMPAHNAEGLIAHAIESALNTATGLREIIVVDDGSTDATAEIAEGFGPPVRVIRQANVGCAGARNAAIAAGTAEYVGLLDADDVWCPPSPDPRLAALAADPTVALAHGAALPVARQADGEWHPTGMDLNFPVPSTWIMRRTALEQFGGFTLDHLNAEDLDMVLRIGESGWRIAACDEVVAHYRLHAASVSRNREVSRAGMLGAIHASIVRRRGTGA